MKKKILFFLPLAAVILSGCNKGNTTTSESEVSSHEHNYVMTFVEATCTNNYEYDLYTCSICGDSYKENVQFKAVSHEYVYYPATATYLKAGKVAYSKCENCGTYTDYLGNTLKEEDLSVDSLTAYTITYALEDIEEYKVEYYDSYQRLLAEEYLGSCDSQKRNIYSYDIRGNLESITYEKEEYGTVTKYTVEYENTYGDILYPTSTKIIGPDFLKLVTYTYGKHNVLTEKTETDSDGLVSTITYTYNDLGHLSTVQSKNEKKTYTYTDGFISSIKTESYKDNVLVKEVTEKFTREDNTLTETEYEVKEYGDTTSYSLTTVKDDCSMEIVSRTDSVTTKTTVSRTYSNRKITSLTEVKENVTSTTTVKTVKEYTYNSLNLISEIKESVYEENIFVKEVKTVFTYENNTLSGKTVTTTLADGTVTTK